MAARRGGPVRVLAAGWVSAAPVRRSRSRLDRAIDVAGLRRKAADSAAARIRAMFDPPVDRVPFHERQLRLINSVPAGADAKVTGCPGLAHLADLAMQ